METFVRMIGVLRDGCEEDFEPNTVEEIFSVHHDSTVELFDVISKKFEAIIRQHGMFGPKTPGNRSQDINELKFVPMHMFARFEFSTKPITPAHIITGPGAELLQ